jgi:hypothetical protein
VGNFKKNTGWRWETAVSWVAFSVEVFLIRNTNQLNSPLDYMPICIAQGVGVGFAVSGLRRGRTLNRFAASIAFGVHCICILAFQLHVWAPGR